MKIIVLSFQGAFLQAESAQSHLTKHFEYFLVKCVPQQSRALNFKEGVLIIKTFFFPFICGISFLSTSILIQIEILL